MQYYKVVKLIINFTIKILFANKSVFFLFLFFLLAETCLAQKIEQVSVMRDVASQRYFRWNYENDMFVFTDFNYTQGYNFELVTPKLVKNPLNFLLIKFANDNNKFGLSIEGIGFTPEDIVSHVIEVGDRPFSSATVIKSFVIATNKSKKFRLSSGLSLGMIGQSTLGKETQVAIHKLTGSAIPNGWKHQIRNDFLINYQLDFEKELLNLNFAVLSGDAKMKLGTLFSNTTLGCNLVVGKYHSALSDTADRPFQFYGFIQPLINFIGYDANLQGGVFNSSSPYTIADKDISRLTFQCNYGLILKFRRIYFEFSQTYLTAEFASGSDVRWGSVRVGWILD